MWTLNGTDVKQLPALIQRKKISSPPELESEGVQKQNKTKQNTAQFFVSRPTYGLSGFTTLFQSYAMDVFCWVCKGEIPIEHWKTEIVD